MVLQKLRSRLQGFGSKAPGTALESELQRATDAASMEVPEDAVLAIVQASHNADDRRQIMLHLHGCLAASASSQWRRVYSGIAVTEALLERGSPEVIAEVADGVHCDLVQRLSFLEAYEYSYDLRVQDMIRRRAQGLRAIWIEKQHALVAPEVERSSDTDDSGDERGKRPEPPKSTSSKAVSLLDDSTTDGESNGPFDPSPRPTSESPNSETAKKWQGRAAVGLDLLGGDAEPAVATASPAAPAPPASVDLLGGEAPEVAPAAPSPPAAAGLDLLLGDFGAAPATASAPSAPLAPPAAAAAPPPPPPPPPAPAPASAAAAPAVAATAPAPAAPGGGMDWLQMAKAHGLYESSAPGAGDLPSGTAVEAAPHGKADLLDF